MDSYSRRVSFARSSHIKEYGQKPCTILMQIKCFLHILTWIFIAQITAEMMKQCTHSANESNCSKQIVITKMFFSFSQFTNKLENANKSTESDISAFEMYIRFVSWLDCTSAEFFGASCRVIYLKRACLCIMLISIFNTSVRRCIWNSFIFIFVSVFVFLCLVFL